MVLLWKNVFVGCVEWLKNFWARAWFWPYLYRYTNKRSRTDLNPFFLVTVLNSGKSFFPHLVLHHIFFTPLVFTSVEKANPDITHDNTNFSQLIQTEMNFWKIWLCFAIVEQKNPLAWTLWVRWPRNNTQLLCS